jgi:hypothetical protein
MKNFLNVLKGAFSIRLFFILTFTIFWGASVFFFPDWPDNLNHLTNFGRITYGISLIISELLGMFLGIYQLILSKSENNQ